MRRWMVIIGVSLLSVMPLLGKEEVMPDLKGKKVLMIIAGNNFRDEEFFQPYDLLKQCGAAVTIASSRKDKARSMFGKSVAPDLLLADCKAADYDAVVFIGGPGASEYFTNPAAHALARSAMESGKILAAICIAPVTLANAGVLKGRKAVCFPSMEEQLARQGAIVGTQAVLQDGRILTATGPEAAKAFAEALVNMLK